MAIKNPAKMAWTWLVTTIGSLYVVVAIIVAILVNTNGTGSFTSWEGAKNTFIDGVAWPVPVSDWLDQNKLCSTAQHPNRISCAFNRPGDLPDVSVHAHSSAPTSTSTHH